MSTSDTPTADFEFATEYRIWWEHNHYTVEDPEQRCVAVLPLGYGGDVVTRTQRWQITVERRGITWAITAHTAADRTEAGGIREGLVPDRHKLWVGDDDEYHMTENPFDCDATIHHRHDTLARIADVRSFLYGSAPAHGGRTHAGTITTLASPASPAELALPILLTLEMIKADAVASQDATAGGGGINPGII
jgi:hypothetical protein